MQGCGTFITDHFGCGYTKTFLGHILTLNFHGPIFQEVNGILEQQAPLYLRDQVIETKIAHHREDCDRLSTMLGHKQFSRMNCSRILKVIHEDLRRKLKNVKHREMQYCLQSHL